MKAKIIIIAALAAILASCQRDLETQVGVRELKISIPELKGETRVTDPNADGLQQWENGDVVFLFVSTIPETTIANPIIATRVAGNWTGLPTIAVPVDATKVNIKAFHTFGRPWDEVFYDHDMLFSRTYISIDEDHPIDTSVELNEFDHYPSRIRFTGLANGDIVWIKPCDNWGKSKITENGILEYSSFADGDFVEANNNGVATFYPCLIEDDASTRQFAVTAAGGTRPADDDDVWHTFNPGEPNMEDVLYINRTYEIAFDVPPGDPGMDDEDEWKSVNEQLVAAGYTYAIRSYADLATLRDEVNEQRPITSNLGIGKIDAETAKVIQLEDIDMSDEGNWKQIGEDNNHPFQGVYNGNGKTITGMEVGESGNSYVGLFGAIKGNGTDQGIIANVTLVDCKVTGRNYIGALAGYIDNAVISNCHASGTVNSSATTGGLVGACYNSTSITRSSSTCEVISDTEAAGGLVGNIDGSSIAVCWATGDVSNNSWAGGLAGVNQGNIYFCYATGNVSIINSTLSIAAGFVGENRGNIYNCYATGSVTGPNTGLFTGSPEDNNDYKSSVKAGDTTFTTKTVRTTGYTIAVEDYTFNVADVWNDAIPPTLNIDLN